MLDRNELESTQVATAAIAYYLYRLAGCPLGDSISGFHAWLDVSVLIPFTQLVEKG